MSAGSLAIINIIANQLIQTVYMLNIVPSIGGRMDLFGYHIACQTEIKVCRYSDNNDIDAKLRLVEAYGT